MLTVSIDENVKRIAGLSDEDVNMLRDDGIRNEDDLGFWELEDLSAEISVVKRRKLALITKFLNVEGNLLSITTTIEDVKNTTATTKVNENYQLSEEGSSMDDNIKRIAGLSDADVKNALQAYGGTMNENDLKKVINFFKYEEISIAKREKLFIIQEFLNFEGNHLIPTTTFADVLQLTEESYNQRREQLKPTITVPAYFNMCKQKCFLASKVVTKKEDGFKKNLTNISKIKVKLEVRCGARMGAGLNKDYLQPSGFKDDVPLGASAIVLNHEDLALQHDALDEKGGWISHFAEYASATKYGVLILAGAMDNFQTWAKSQACLKEVSQIPKGRLFAFIQHTEDDEGGSSGYIVSVDAENGTGSPTVCNGIGYMIWHDSRCYHGQLQNSIMHGHGVLTYADGNVYDGDFKDGKRHGHGVYTFADGRRKYDGDFKDNLRHGHGLYIYADGRIYDGEYKDGKQHGNEILTYPDGRKYKLVYENGKLVYENGMLISETPIQKPSKFK